MPRGHFGEEHCGAEVVAADVLGQVVEVHAEPDHGRLVHDHVDAGQGGGDGGPVAQVGLA